MHVYIHVPGARPRSLESTSNGQIIGRIYLTYMDPFELNDHYDPGIPGH